MVLLGSENDLVGILETLPRTPSIGFCLSFRCVCLGMFVRLFPVLKLFTHNDFVELYCTSVIHNEYF